MTLTNTGVYAGNANKKPTHYIAMSGMHGCLPDSCNAYQTYQDAVNELATVFELGRTRKARLFANRYLELNTRINTGNNEDYDGADYCEITICHCDKPWEHCDAGDDPRDWQGYGDSGTSGDSGDSSAGE